MLNTSPPRSAPANKDGLRTQSLAPKLAIRQFDRARDDGERAWADGKLAEVCVGGSLGCVYLGARSERAGLLGEAESIFAMACAYHSDPLGCHRWGALALPHKWPNVVETTRRGAIEAIVGDCDPESGPVDALCEPMWLLGDPDNAWHTLLELATDRCEQHHDCDLLTIASWQRSRGLWGPPD